VRAGICPVAQERILDEPSRARLNPPIPLPPTPFIPPVVCGHQAHGASVVRKPSFSTGRLYAPSITSSAVNSGSLCVGQPFLTEPCRWLGVPRRGLYACHGLPMTIGGMNGVAGGSGISVIGPSCLGFLDYSLTGHRRSSYRLPSSQRSLRAVVLRGRRSVRDMGAKVLTIGLVCFLTAAGIVMLGPVLHPLLVNDLPPSPYLEKRGFSRGAADCCHGRRGISHPGYTTARFTRRRRAPGRSQPQVLHRRRSADCLAGQAPCVRPEREIRPARFHASYRLMQRHAAKLPETPEEPGAAQ